MTNNPQITFDTVRLLMPEIIVIATSVAVYILGAFTDRRTGWGLLALAGLGAAGVAMFRQDAWLEVFSSPRMLGASGPLLLDYFGHAARWVVLGVGFLFVLIAWRAAREDLATDYLGSLLLVVAGAMLLCTAGDLVLLFLALELISIPTYVLLFLGRNNAASHEATAKYFFLSVLSSALLLYGFSFLYGVAGSTRLDEIRAAIAGGEAEGLADLLPLALMLVFAGAGFRMAAVPFHFYAPDVYQGTTSGNAGLLSVVPKIAGIVVLVRLVLVAMPGLEETAWRVAMGLSMLTMTVGNVLALWQRNIRRLLAYSSIAHAGYMLIGFSVALAVAAGAGTSREVDGLAAMLFYTLVYIPAAAGAFAALAYLGHAEQEIDTVDDLAGLSKSQPLLALTIALFMFSLAGLPPLAGFLGKLTLFLGALDVDAVAAEAPYRPWFLALAVVGALNAAIAAAYYLRVVAVMYFREPVYVPRAEGGAGAWLAAMASALVIIAATFYGGDLIQSATDASRSVRDAPPPAVERVATQQQRGTNDQ